MDFNKNWNSELASKIADNVKTSLNNFKKSGKFKEEEFDSYYNSVKKMKEKDGIQAFIKKKESKNSKNKIGTVKIYYYFYNTHYKNNIIPKTIKILNNEFKFIDIVDIKEIETRGESKFKMSLLTLVEGNIEIFKKIDDNIKITIDFEKPTTIFKECRSKIIEEFEKDSGEKVSYHKHKMIEHDAIITIELIDSNEIKEIVCEFNENKSHKKVSDAHRKSLLRLPSGSLLIKKETDKNINSWDNYMNCIIDEIIFNICMITKNKLYYTKYLMKNFIKSEEEEELVSKLLESINTKKFPFSVISVCFMFLMSDFSDDGVKEYLVEKDILHDDMNDEYSIDEHGNLYFNADQFLRFKALASLEMCNNYNTIVKMYDYSMKALYDASEMMLQRGHNSNMTSEDVSNYISEVVGGPVREILEKKDDRIKQLESYENLFKNMKNCYSKKPLPWLKYKQNSMIKENELIAIKKIIHSYKKIERTIEYLNQQNNKPNIEWINKDNFNHIKIMHAEIDYNEFRKFHNIDILKLFLY